MSFPTKLLAQGEEVYLDSKPNWSFLFWPSAFALVVIAACIAVVVLWSSRPGYVNWILLGCGVAALVYFGVRYLGWFTTSFVVTSQRIVYRTGVLRTTGREIPIGRVQDVTYHQTIIERIVRAGSLTVESAGRYGQDPFPDISRPAEVQSLINRVVGQAGGGYAVSQGATTSVVDTTVEEVSQPITDPTPRVVPPTPTRVDTAPEPAPPPAAVHTAVPSITEQMAELAELHRHGVITDAEYEQKRRELLDRL
jgi:membrane protein YdbS with pleckstrin-like domain